MRDDAAAAVITGVLCFIFGCIFALGSVSRRSNHIGWEKVNGKNYVEYHDSLWTLKPVELEE